MATTYTNNLGIKKPENGSLSGTWGDMVNTNMDIIDRAVDGSLELSLSLTSSTLVTGDGTLTDGQYKALILGGSPSGTHTITLTPNDSQKIYYVVNNTAQSVVFTQGSGGNVTILAGTAKIIRANGGGSAAAVTALTDDLYLDTPTLNAPVVTGNMVVDTSTLVVDAANNLVGVGTATPTTQLHVSGSTSSTCTFTASISGTTMTVSAIASGSLAVGNLICYPSVAPLTRIISQTSGTSGLTGTYTVSVAQTVASATMYNAPGAPAAIRVTDTDTSVVGGQVTGRVEFYGSSTSTPGAGIGAYVASIAEDASPDTALVFGTRDSAAAGVDATEALRITSGKLVGIGTSTPEAPLHLVSTDASDTVILEVSDATSTAAPDLVLYRNSASPAAADELGSILFRGKDSAGNTADYARIGARLDDATNTSEDGSLHISTAVAGTQTVHTTFYPTAMALASGYSLGVGTATPAAIMDIAGTTGDIAALVSGYIFDGVTSGTAGTVLSVTTADTDPAKLLAVGQYIYGDGIAVNTYITALGTGTGGVGTYTVSTSQAAGTFASPIQMQAIVGKTNRLRFTDTDTSTAINQPIGTVEFYTSDASAPGSGVGAFMSAITETSTPDVSLVFGTRDNPATGSGAKERLRLGSAGAIGLGGANYGTAGQLLTSGGSSASPTWTDGPVGAWEIADTLLNGAAAVTTVISDDFADGYEYQLQYKDVTATGTGQWTIIVMFETGGSSPYLNVTGVATASTTDDLWAYTDFPLARLSNTMHFVRSAGNEDANLSTTSYGAMLRSNVQEYAVSSNGATKIKNVSVYTPAGTFSGGTITLMRRKIYNA